MLTHQQPSTAPLSLVANALRGAFLNGYVALALAVSTIWLAFTLTDFQADASLASALASCCIILAAAGGLRTLGRNRIACGFEVLVLTSAVSISMGLLSIILASTSRPFVDASLARWDSWLFGKSAWPTILELVRQHPRVMAWLSVIYDTLNLQPLILIPALLMVGATSRLRMFALAWMISIAAAVLISPFTPAAGTYLHYGIARASVPGVRLDLAWHHIDFLDAARDGRLRSLGMNSLVGIVTFPSFHAAGAILLGWAAWGCRQLRAPGTILNVLLFASAIFIGGHYLVDVIAGTLIALASLATARRMERGNLTQYQAGQLCAGLHA